MCMLHLAHQCNCHCETQKGNTPYTIFHFIFRLNGRRHHQTPSKFAFLFFFSTGQKHPYCWGSAKKKLWLLISHWEKKSFDTRFSMGIAMPNSKLSNWLLSRNKYGSGRMALMVDNIHSICMQCMPQCHSKISWYPLRITLGSIQKSIYTLSPLLSLCS